VGSELGATYTCTGNATYVDLEHTRIITGTARVDRYSAAVKGMDRMRGVMPDIPVDITQEEIVSGADTVLDFVLSLAVKQEE